MGIPKGSIPSALQQANSVLVPSRLLRAAHTCHNRAGSLPPTRLPHHRDSPQGKHIRVLGEGQLVLLGVWRELADDLGGKVAQPAVLDPQLVLSPAKTWSQSRG